MIAHVNGIDLYYEKKGEGRPLIMVHGNGEDHTIFREASMLLEKNFTCYLVDSRSHGKSTDAGELHYEDMAADMTAFMEKLDLQDVVFYGFSDGGIIGLLAAAQCTRVKTLIVSGANLTPEGVILPFRLLIRGMYIFNKDPKIRLMMEEPHIPDKVLQRITAKTLVLAGSHDMVREKETRHIARMIPGAKLYILKGEGHGSYIVHKERIGKIIMKFAGKGTVKKASF